MENIINKLQEKISLYEEGSLTKEDLIKDLLDLMMSNFDNSDLNNTLNKILEILNSKQNNKQNEDNEQNNKQNEEIDEEVAEIMSKKYFLIWENSNNPVLKNINIPNLISKLEKHKKIIPIKIDHIDEVDDIKLSKIYKEDGKYFVELKGNKKILEKYSIIFICDEVQTGNGRTGRLWGIENYNVIPDIMTTSKAIANGLPLSVTMYREEYDSYLNPGEHFSTLGGNAIACVTAEIVLDELIGKNIIKETYEKGEYFKKRLEELKEKYEIIGDIRGIGLLIGIEFVKNKKTKQSGKEEAIRFLNELWKRKILVGIGGIEGNIIRIEPPLIIKKENIDYAIEVFDEVLKNI